jgi:transposase
MKQVLLKAKKLKEEAIQKWKTYLEKEVLNEIHNEFQTILQNWKTEYGEVNKRTSPKRWRVKKSKWLNLLERLEQSENWTLWFVDNFLIPFDNNLAERDLRLIKTRTKISGCFRSFLGAKYFCRIRSYISTMRKQWFDIYKALSSIFSWKILLPNF